MILEYCGNCRVRRARVGILCGPCHREAKARFKAKYDARKADRLCVACPDPPRHAVVGRVYCEDHLRKKTDEQDRYRTRLPTVNFNMERSTLERLDAFVKKSGAPRAQTIRCAIEMFLDVLEEADEVAA